MSKKQKISIAEQVALVRQYTQEEISIQEARLISSDAVITVRIWNCQYHAERVEAFLPWRKVLVCPVKLKHTAVSAYLACEGTAYWISVKHTKFEIRIF